MVTSLIWTKFFLSSPTRAMEMQTPGRRNFLTWLSKKTTQNSSPLSLGTYKELIDLIVKDFSLYDTLKYGIYEMEELKMGNTTIEE